MKDKDILVKLENTYCDSIGFEIYTYLGRKKAPIATGTH